MFLDTVAAAKERGKSNRGAFTFSLFPLACARGGGA